MNKLNIFKFKNKGYETQYIGVKLIFNMKNILKLMFKDIKDFNKVTYNVVKNIENKRLTFEFKKDE